MCKHQCSTQRVKLRRFDSTRPGLPLGPCRQIGVAGQGFLVKRDRIARLFVVDLSRLDRLFDGVLQILDQFAFVVLDVGEHFVDGVPFDDRLDFHGTLVQIDVHGMRVTEQVVQIAQDLLVSSDQKDRNLVRLVTLQFMQHQSLSAFAAADKRVDFTIAVTGDVPQHGSPRGTLRQIDGSA